MENNRINNNGINRYHHHQPQQPLQQPPLTKQEEREQKHRQNFRIKQMQAIENVKPHQLPLARIKKIMKSDRDVHMISAEAPIIFAKACEMFILDLTMRSWLNAEDSRHRTLQKSDISTAVAETCTFDFLLDVVPRHEPVVTVPTANPGFVAMPHPSFGLPFYYPPGMVTGNPVVDESGIYTPSSMNEWSESWLKDLEEEDDEEDEAESSEGN